MYEYFITHYTGKEIVYLNYDMAGNLFWGPKAEYGTLRFGTKKDTDEFSDRIKDKNPAKPNCKFNPFRDFLKAF